MQSTALNSLNNFLERRRRLRLLGPALVLLRRFGGAARGGALPERPVEGPRGRRLPQRREGHPEEPRLAALSLRSRTTPEFSHCCLDRGCAIYDASTLDLFLCRGPRGEGEEGDQAERGQSGLGGRSPSGDRVSGRPHALGTLFSAVVDFLALS